MSDGSSVRWTGYAALAVAGLVFSGWFTHAGEWYGCLDFSTMNGAFGTVGGLSFVGAGGTGARHAFLYALSLAPGIMLALGIIAVAEHFDALRAADRLLNPLLRPCLGLPGVAGLALIGSLQSTDAGAAMTRDLRDKGLLTERELIVFAMFQFSSGGTIVNYLTTGLAVFPFLPTDHLKPLGVILICKVLGANLMRPYLRFTWRNDDRSDRQRHDARPEACRKECPTAPYPSAYDACIKGMTKGWDLVVRGMLPNMILAFVLMKIMEKAGLLPVVGVLFDPIMGLLDLPGEAAAVLLTSWFSIAAGVGTAASLCLTGTITGEHLLVLVPGMYLLAAQIQYMGRLLAVAGVPVRHVPVICLIGIINAVAGMALMRLFMH